MNSSVRRTKRRKSQQLHFQKFWDSCAQNKKSEISKTAPSEIRGLWFAEQNVGNLKKTHVHTFWDSGSQNKPSEIATNAPSQSLGLLFAAQNVGNIKQCTFRYYGAPVRRTTRRNIE